MNHQKHPHISDLEELFECGKTLSFHHQDKPCAWQEHIASMVFSKSLLNAMSLLRLTPTSRFCSPVDGLIVWDLCSVAAISRNIIETYLALHYFCQRLTDSEWLLRKLIWEFHEVSERVAMANACIPKSKKLPPVRAQHQAAKSALQICPEFAKLPAKQQKKILSGQSSRLLTNDALCGTAGISANYHRGMFKYLSNHTHCSPFAIADLDAMRVTRPETIRAFNSSVDVALGHTALAIRDFSQFFQSPPELLTEKARQQIAVWEDVFRWENSSFYHLA